MGNRKDGFGWVSPEKDVSCPDFNDVPTRVVQIDRIDQELKQRFEANSSIGTDATVLQKKKDDSVSPTNRRSAQYIPVAGVRKTGEVTALWVPKKRFGFLLVWDFMRAKTKGRLAILCIVICLLVVGAFVIPFFLEIKKTSADPNRGLKVNRAEESEMHRVEDEGSSSLGPVSDGGKHEEHPSLKNAADALVDGRLAEALGVYRRLARAFPDDESYALAAEILGREKRSESP